MWPVKNSHEPARKPCAYVISVLPMRVGAIHFTSAITVFLHAQSIVAAAARTVEGEAVNCLRARSRRQKEQRLMKVRSLTLAWGNLTVLQPSCSCCPPEAEFVAGRQPSQDVR